MSAKENTLPEENPPARRSHAISKTERMQDILLVLSIAQLITALLLYLLEYTLPVTFVIEILIAVGLALLARFQYEHRAARVLLRILGIAIVLLPLLVSAVFISLYYAEAAVYGSPDTMALFQADLWRFYALIVMPPLLFMQPVFAVNATSRRRFDLVLLRIITSAGLVFSVLLCLFAFQYRLNGEQAVLTLQTFSFDLFGSARLLTVAIDSIPTRILFCLFSAAMVFLSFRIRSVRRNA